MLFAILAPFRRASRHQPELQTGISARECRSAQAGIGRGATGPNRCQSRLSSVLVGPRFNRGLLSSPAQDKWPAASLHLHLHLHRRHRHIHLMPPPPTEHHTLDQIGGLILYYDTPACRRQTSNGPVRVLGTEGPARGVMRSGAGLAQMVLTAEAEAARDA